MSDQDGGTDELPEDQQRQVAAMLAATPPEPMPADVAARLQAVLRAEARARDAAAPRPPVPLASRRRRLVPVLAAAAVTVGVVAIGGTVLTEQVGGGGGSEADGGAAAEAPSRSDAREDGEPGALAQPPAPQRQAPSDPASLPRVDDLAALPSALRPAPAAAGAATPACRADALDAPSAETRQVLLRGAPAWLVVDGSDPDRVTAYRCDGVPDGDPAVEVESATLR